MRDFLPADLPWGRPAVDSIPLPPFATAAEHDRFSRMLALHVALVDEGGPSLAAKTLCAALTPRGERPAELTAFELQVAMTTLFPAAWTPEILAEHLAALDVRSPQALSEGRWTWDFDPHFIAAPRPGGGWTIERNERGSRSSQDLEHDGDLVILWMEWYSGRRSYPFGYRVEDGDLTALADAARAVREVHASDVAFRYSEDWRDKRDAALG